MKTVLVLILFIGVVSAFSARRFSRGRDSEDSDERRVYKTRHHYYFSKYVHGYPPTKHARSYGDSSEEEEDSSDEEENETKHNARPQVAAGSAGKGGNGAPVSPAKKPQPAKPNPAKKPEAANQTPAKKPEIANQNQDKKPATTNQKEVTKPEESEATEEEEEEEEEDEEEGEEAEEVEENGEGKNGTESNGEMEDEGEENVNGTETGANSTMAMDAEQDYANATTEGYASETQPNPTSVHNTEEPQTTAASERDNGNIDETDTATAKNVNIQLALEITTAAATEGPAEDVIVDVTTIAPSEPEYVETPANEIQAENEADSSTTDYEHGNEYDHVITRGDNFAPYHPYEDEYNYKGYHGYPGYDDYAVQEYYNEA